MVFDSLKDLWTFASFWEEIVDPGSEHLTSLYEFGWVRISWGVHFNAVSTVFTVRNSSNLVQSNVGSHLCSPLPWVLHTVGKENVFLGKGIFNAALTNASLISQRRRWHATANAENFFAHVGPVRLGEHCGSHNVVYILTWDLEPTVLCAVLECPGTSWGCDRRSISCLSSNISIIVTRCYTDGCTICGHDRDNIVLRCTSVVRKCRAHLGSMTVLDRLYEDISVIEHPIVSVHSYVFWVTCESCVDNGISSTTITQGTLICHVSHRCLNRCRTVCTGQGRWCVGLIIKLPEVDNRLYNTWGRPSTNCKVRIALSEPGRKCARVATSNDEHFVGLIRIDISNEVGKISHRLLRVQSTQVLELPV